MMNKSQLGETSGIKFRFSCKTHRLEYLNGSSFLQGSVCLVDDVERLNSDRSLNVGVRIFDIELTRVLFETVIPFSETVITPGTWFDVQIDIPHFGNHVGGNVIAVFDIVSRIGRESSFNDRLAAFDLAYDPKESAQPRIDVMNSSVAAESGPDVEYRKQIMDELPVTRDPNRSLAQTTFMVFDVSDLIQYFFNARLPTGIQRVQIEVITSLIFRQKDFRLQIVSFNKETDRWIVIPELFFNHICKLALVGGEKNAPDWTRVLSELRENLTLAAVVDFKEGSFLINLGTSWWLKNYFLHVRYAKARFGIRYVPYIHDCIPIITPEHCVEELTRDFISWGLGAFEHADHILVNSKSTADDVVRVASHLGHHIATPSIVKLDADYRLAVSKLDIVTQRSTVANLFDMGDLQYDNYALFVSTIESRKNHVLALSTWLNLLKKFGSDHVPKLVCVGNNGWLNDSVFATLKASKQLQSHVIMLSKIPDQDLRRLYEECAFTIYPSKYEGWGLPITESLCFGKIPVVNRSSSLPEAAGEFGEYFDLDSEKDFTRAVSRLIFDKDYKRSREDFIIMEFRPRPWEAIADQIVADVMRWSDERIDLPNLDLRARGVWPVEAEWGTFHSLAENMETQVWSNMRAGEIYRQGDGWWWPEPWGCWTKPDGARLAFYVRDGAQEKLAIYVCLRGLDDADSRVKVKVEGGVSRSVLVPAGQDKWVVLTIDLEDLSRVNMQRPVVVINISGDRHSDFRKNTGGVDPRVVAVGVRGFMVCPSDDLQSRLNLVEIVGLGDFSALTERPPNATDLLLSRD